MTNALLAIAVIAFVLYRQLRTRPVKEQSAARLVGILGIIGVIEVAQAVGKVSTTAATAAVAVTAAGLVIAAALGALRAKTMVMWRDDTGAAWQKGRALTVVLWAVSIGAHIALDLSVTGIKGAGTVTSAGILLFLAVSLGAQMEVARYRAARMAAASKSGAVIVDAR